LYLEFYDFNNENLRISPSPLRITFLSQLLRPLWCHKVSYFFDESIAPDLKIDSSFTGDRVVIREDQSQFIIVYLKPDWTLKGTAVFYINDATIESLTLSCSKLYVKSNGFYYQLHGTYFSDNYGGKNDLSLTVSLA
jgi:hypothetical protein